jgi:hypothetical protein
VTKIEYCNDWLLNSWFLNKQDFNYREFIKKLHTFSNIINRNILGNLLIKYLNNNSLESKVKSFLENKTNDVYLQHYNHNLDYMYEINEAIISINNNKSYTITNEEYQHHYNINYNHGQFCHLSYTHVV